MSLHGLNQSPTVRNQVRKQNKNFDETAKQRTTKDNRTYLPKSIRRTGREEEALAGTPGPLDRHNNSAGFKGTVHCTVLSIKMDQLTGL